MKKNILKILILTFITTSISISAQNIKGLAYYKTKRKVDLQLDHTQVSDEQKKLINERLKKQFERTYILTFEKEASTYTMEETLEFPSSNSNGMQIRMVGGPGDSNLYKNTKTRNYSNEQNLFGKQFLIKDTLESLDWKLEDASKIIGKYLCFKATAVREVENSDARFANSENEISSDSIAPTIERTITAWYTTDIPINHGPSEFWGLPGLILELNDGDNMQYICNKIVMHTKSNISEPTKGKIVSQEEFDKIRNQKIEEMRKNRGREGRNSDGNIRIRIGG